MTDKHQTRAVFLTYEKAKSFCFCFEKCPLLLRCEEINIPKLLAKVQWVNFSEGNLAIIIHSLTNVHTLTQRIYHENLS